MSFDTQLNAQLFQEVDFKDLALSQSDIQDLQQLIMKEGDVQTQVDGDKFIVRG